MRTRTHQSQCLRRVDRLSLVTLALVGLASACGSDKGDPKASSRGRFEAVEAKPIHATSPLNSARIGKPAAGPNFRSRRSPARCRVPDQCDGSTSGPRGVSPASKNSRASSTGRPSSTRPDIPRRSCSSRSTAATWNIRAFIETHPEVEGTLQITEPDALPDWLVSLGLPGNAVLPIHLFVDASGKLRCVRMGGVGPEDYPGVEAVIGSI